MSRLSLFILLIAGTTHLLCAEDKPKADDEIYLDPANAGVDYAIQGEYRGLLDPDGDRVDFGLQVVALGDHKFDGVAYIGGLPGDGWERGDEMINATGVTENGETKLASETGYAIVKDGKAVIYNRKDRALGTLQKVVRKSPTLGAKPPQSASVWFDGTTAEQFERGEITMKNLLAANCESKENLGDHTMHLEFRTPFKPKARGQARGNSGVYLQSRYECQVLDSFGLEGKDNECGGIYSISPPEVNACFPPLTWQTYDIEFTAAVWESGEKVTNARTTIRHNGIVIHDDRELPHGTPGKLKEEAGPAPLYLQGHGNPVVYRNIWVVQR